MPKKRPASSRATAIELIPFVRPSNRRSIEEEKSSERNTKPRTEKDGKEVKSFYEHVVGIGQNEVSESGTASCANITDRSLEYKQRAKKQNISRVKEEKSNEACIMQPSTSEEYFNLLNGLLRAAQNGEKKTLEKCVAQGVDVNGQDQYGWTALMCAAHSGHCAIARFLLDSGAHVTLRNNKGHTSWDIAKVARKSKVVNLLENYSDIVREERESKEISDVFETFYCDVCQRDVAGASRSKHCCSTVHQLNMGHKVKDTSFAIPEHNKGFQLMLKSGWDQDRGLGPDGTGQKYPVKTHLKRDRLGLGETSKDSSKAKKKVTHFDANDAQAVAGSRRMRKVTLSKRAASKKARMEKEFERNFKLEFSSY